MHADIGWAAKETGLRFLTRHTSSGESRGGMRGRRARGWFGGGLESVELRKRGGARAGLAWVGAGTRWQGKVGKVRLVR